MKSLQHRSDEFKKSFETGDPAPRFSLFNQNHVQVDSKDLLREGQLVVSFFRGHW